MKIKIVVIALLVASALRMTSYAQNAKEEEAFFVARKAFADGFYDVSLQLAERFLAGYPASTYLPEVNLLIGQCYFHQGKFLDALAKFEGLLNQAAAKDIQDAVAYWIAEVQFRGNNFSRAAEYYKKIVDEYPGSTYASAAYYSLGWCRFQEHAFREALEYFQTVEEKFPKESLAQDTQFKIIECLYNLKDYAGLKERLKSYLKLYTKETAKAPYLYFYFAEAEYYLGNFSEAINWYQKTVSATRDERLHSLARLGMGWAHLKLKQYSESEAVFSQVASDSLEASSRDVLLLGRAILGVETQKLDDARSLYDQLLSVTQDPVVSIQAYLGKADVLYNIAQYKEAIEVYQEALGKITSAIPQEIVDKVHYGLAWVYLKEGEFKAAIEEFQKIVQHTEDKIIKVATLCQIGDAYQDSGDYAKATETYDGILKDYSDSLYSDYVQYQLGLTMLKASNYPGAIAAFQALKTNFPGSKLLDEASYALGLSYFQREDYAASKEVFERFAKEFKGSSLEAQAAYLFGTSLFNLGDYAGSIEAFKGITKTYAHDTELVQKAEYEIADCYYQMGNEKQAMALFKALSEKYPYSTLTPEVIWWLGEYYYRHSDRESAKQYFSSLIRDFPQSALLPDAHYALASLYDEETNYQEALNNFRKVIELAKSDLAATALIAIADIYVKQNQTDVALSTYKDVVHSYPNLAHLVYPKMAQAYRKAGNYDEAVECYSRSIEIVPAQEMAQIQFGIAEVREAQGRQEAAIEEYLKVTYLYGQDEAVKVKAFLRVAALYENSENFPEALKAYQKVAEMNVEEAKYAQERIDSITAQTNKQ